MAQTRPSPTLSRGFTRLGRFLAPYGVLAGLSQTTVYDTILTGHARPTPDRSGPKCHLSHSGCWLERNQYTSLFSLGGFGRSDYVKSPSHK